MGEAALSLQQPCWVVVFCCFVLVFCVSSFFFFPFDIAASEEPPVPAQGKHRSLIGFGCGREGKVSARVED